MNILSGIEPAALRYIHELVVKTRQLDSVAQLVRALRQIIKGRLLQFSQDLRREKKSSI
jgi:hypothetical protein